VCPVIAKMDGSITGFVRISDHDRIGFLREEFKGEKPKSFLAQGLYFNST
jgi:hypothetical protein